jgi:2-(3-amino-3-carboxypropyl)histidine synthase
MYLDLDLKGLKKEIEKTKAKNIFVQLPEGLKIKMAEIQDNLKDYNLFFSIEPVFGACDLQEDKAEKVKADLIIHFGHSKFSDYKKIDVLYWPTYYVVEEIAIRNMYKKIDKKFKDKRIAILGPIQYNKLILTLKDYLKRSRVVEIIEPTKTERCLPNQILGCKTSLINQLENKIDAIVYVGDGNFHPTNYSLGSSKIKVYKLLPESDFEEIITDDSEEKRLKFLQAIIKDKNNFGIYISSKIGQNDLEKALLAKERLEKADKKVYLLIADNLSDEKILGLGLEVIINTACPRIQDDYKNYKPIIININYIFNIF